MKTISRVAIVFFVLINMFACTKKDTSSSQLNTSNSNPQPTITNYSINGVAANAPIPASYTLGGNFIVEATDNNSYPQTQIQLTFSGNMSPVSGPYTIVHTATSPFYCSFLITTTTSSTITPTVISTASSGIVTIAAATTPNNSASFSSILCTNTGTTTTTYTVSGTIKY